MTDKVVKLLPPDQREVADLLEAVGKDVDKIGTIVMAVLYKDGESYVLHPQITGPEFAYLNKLMDYAVYSTFFNGE